MVACDCEGVAVEMPLVKHQLQHPWHTYTRVGSKARVTKLSHTHTTNCTDHELNVSQ